MDPRVERAVSADYLREIVERLSTFRSHPLGFRVAGTPEERAATRYIAGEMRDLGLVDVVEEPVPVDAWRLGEAFVEIDGGTRYDSASMGGVPETGPDGVRGELVFVERGSRRDLDGVDLAGRVALVDWKDESLWPYEVALELGSRGAAAMLLTSFRGGPYYQADGALGTFDAMWHAGGPPMVTVRREDAGELLRHEGRPVRVVLVAPLARGAEAANVVGTLPGRRGGPVIVGGHHDGWFEAAFDDATGVAVTLALARAYAEAGVRPRRPIVFVSHTAEEYGIAESRYDWCYGAWYQVAETHRDWGARAAFYLNVEGSGFPAPLTVDPPPELRAWARRLCRAGERDRLLPHGWQIRSPNTWTEVWTFLAAGIPGVNVSTFSSEYKQTLYHTQYDTPDRVDFDYLVGLTRLYGRFLAGAVEDPGAILDYGERARDVARTAPELADAARPLAEASGRRRFTALGRGLYGLDASDAASYPHEQTRRDVERLEAALEALRRGDRRRAAREAERVGLNALARDLSRDVFRGEHARRGRRAPRACWAAQGDPDRGPDLWEELASLRGEAGAREPGAWIERSLERQLARSRRELDRRLGRMRRALEGRVAPLPRAHA